MTSIKISTLPAGMTLGGGERLLAVQDGDNVAITPAQIAAYAQTGSQGEAYTGPVAARGAVPNVTSTTNKSAQDMTVHFATDDILFSKPLFINAYIDGGGGGGTFVERRRRAPSRGRRASSRDRRRLLPVLVRRRRDRFGCDRRAGRDRLAHPSADKGGQSLPDAQSSHRQRQLLRRAPATQVPARRGVRAGPATTDKTTSGTIPAAAGNYRSPPVAVLGMTRKGTLLLLSNSRGRCVGDTLDRRGLAGAIERSLAGIALLNASTGGDAVVNYLASHGLRQQLAAY